MPVCQFQHFPGIAGGIIVERERGVNKYLLPCLNTDLRYPLAKLLKNTAFLFTDIIFLLMGKVINTDTGGKQRNYLTKYILLACKVSDFSELSMAELQDRAAFVYFSLIAIEQSINSTVTAWEKRDFWVKADKFRLEWAWADKIARKLKHAIDMSDQNLIIQFLQELHQYLDTITRISSKSQTNPWLGAWDRYVKLNNSRRN